jgi:hypothetical protein
MNDPAARAKKGVHFLEESIIELLKQHPDGLTNYAIAKTLEIESDQEGRQKNYLSWSILGRLMKQSLVTRTKTADGKHVLYRANF